MLISRLRTLARDERGIALVMAIGMLAALSISVSSVVYFTSTNSRSATVSREHQRAYFLAEAGVNNAFSILAKPGNNALDPYQLCPDASTQPTLPCVHTDGPYDNYDGTVTWSGTLTRPPFGGGWWTIKSTGNVRGPANTTSRLRRTIIATIAVVPTPSQQLNNSAWDYIFVRAPTWTGQALNGCDMTIQQSVNVQSNLYVMGNLCVQNTATMTKGKLYVKGSLDQQQSANHMGAQGADLPMAHIQLGCRYQNQVLHNPCIYGAGGGHGANADNVWANPLDNTWSTIDPPTADFDGWYLNASPGPYFPCNPRQTGDPPLPSFSFDNPVGQLWQTDATRLAFKNDNQGVVNLTPGTSYTCKTSGGELSWDATNHVLTTAGTIFIDGSATIQNGVTNIYKGSATIYISGTFLLKGGGANTRLCPNSSWTGTTCDTSKWDTKKDLLAIIVNGNGSVPADNQVAAGDGAQFVSSYFMGAVWASNVIDIDTTALVDGPLDGSTVKLGQSSNSTFAGFTFVPAGLPGEDPVYADPQAPTFSGG